MPSAAVFGSFAAIECEVQDVAVILPHLFGVTRKQPRLIRRPDLVLNDDSPAWMIGRESRDRCCSTRDRHSHHHDRNRLSRAAGGNPPSFPEIAQAIVGGRATPRGIGSAE